MILYLNSCVREESRTNRIARTLLKKLMQEEQDTVTELILTNENMSPLNKERLNYRTALLEKRDYEDSIFDYAKQFAEADIIVIAAPYWDAGFPACLKIYLENICVSGIVFRYEENGHPIGLCRGKKLYYVTTAGGPYIPDFSYEYIRSIAKLFFGIPEAELIKAEMLDVDGFDAEKILEETVQNIITH